jgi:hypothetical protein
LFKAGCAAGLVGIIPALGMMSPEQNPPDGPIVFSPGQLLLWSLGLAFFGVFIAVPLRTQTIIKVNFVIHLMAGLHAMPLPDFSIAYLACTFCGM